MLSANFSELRSGLKQYLDYVENHNETVLIKRSYSKGAVLISIQEYNSIMETLHLLRSKSNSKWLFDSIQQIENGDFVSNQLIETE